MSERCPTCGASVRIEASGVTHYMVPADAERVRELTALVESAYREGFWDGYDDDARPMDADAGWEHSEAKKGLEPPMRLDLRTGAFRRLLE